MIFKVYHAVNIALIPQVPKRFPTKAFTLVAEVEADNVEQVYQLTNNTNQGWWKNAQVKLLKKSRSTSVGDVIVGPHGERHFIDFAGTKEF